MLDKKDLIELREAIKNDLKKEIFNQIDDAVALIIDVMSKGFKEVGDRLDKVESRLDKVESRLSRVEDRLDVVETDLLDVKRGIKDLQADAPTMVEFKNQEKRIIKLEEVVFAH